MVDVSVILTDVVLLESTKLVRNKTTWADIKFTITNEIGSAIPETQYPNTNFNITLGYINNNSLIANQSTSNYFMTLTIDEIDMNLNRSMDKNQTVSVTAK